MGLQLITAPGAEPVTSAEVKTHSRIDTSADDAYIDTLIVSARKSIETLTGRALINQTWDLSMDLEPGLSILRLPLPPLSSVTSIKYYSEADVESTYATTNYRVDTSDSQGGRISLRDGRTWPTDMRYTNGLIVRFVAGYGAAGSNVPEPLRHAIKLLAAHWYENREPVNIGNIVNEIQLMIEHLCWPFKVIRL